MVQWPPCAAKHRRAARIAAPAPGVTSARPAIGGGARYRPDMSRLPELRHDQLSPDGRAVWDAIVGSRGSRLETPAGGLAGPFNAFVHAPDVGRGLTGLGASLRFGTSIERRLTEVAIITVGARWQAEFEWWAHARMAREHGVPDAVVDAIGRGEDPPFDAGDERTVHAIARSLVETGSVPAGVYAAGQALLGDTGMVELVSLCGYYTLISFLLNAFEVPLPPGSAPMWPASRG
jgi:4-carboxymuconolactone decarboxylase